MPKIMGRHFTAVTELINFYFLLYNLLLSEVRRYVIYEIKNTSKIPIIVNFPNGVKISHRRKSVRCKKDLPKLLLDKENSSFFSA